MLLTREKIGYCLIALAGVATAALWLTMERIPQDIGYHNLSDAAQYLAIPHALNVLSNIPFVVVGILGLIWLFHNNAQPIDGFQSNRLAYWILFGGITLVGLGSGYYHLAPSNETLVWDRLPMTLVFMALYSVILGEFISETCARRLLLPLLFAGISSVLYWQTTEARGVGDLRFYAVVQFFPLLTIPVVLLFFTSRVTRVSGYWILLASYVVAKLLEHFDSSVHQFLGVVSGHSLKHVAPALGVLYLLHTYKARGSANAPAQ